MRTLKTLVFIGYVLICFLYIFLVSQHPYAWMLDFPGSGITEFCKLPLDNNRATAADVLALAILPVLPLFLHGLYRFIRHEKYLWSWGISGVLFLFCLFRVYPFWAC
jgi:hypothetical protein